MEGVGVLDVVGAALDALPPHSGQDPECVPAFSMSMDAHRLTMGGNTRLVISPDSPFYKYLKYLK